MKINKIDSKKYITTQWSGGKTTQLYIMPEDSVFKNHDFIWRLSTAILEEEKSDFTSFPDYNRILYLLSGKSCIKSGEREQIELLPGNQIRFKGADETKSRGMASDLNLIMRKKCLGSITGHKFHGHLQWRKGPVYGDEKYKFCYLFFIVHGKMEAGNNGDSVVLESGDLLVVTAEETDDILQLDFQSNADLVWIAEVFLCWEED